MKRIQAILMLACLLCATCWRSAGANTIGIGLDWRKNVFVQEYWQDGALHYAVSNLSKAPVTFLVVHHANISDTDKVPALLGPVDIKAGAVAYIDGNTPAFKALPEGSMLTFMAGNEPLGLLFSPGKGTPPGAKVSTYDGLNGSGGRHNNLWIEQDEPQFSAGGEITVTLMVPPNSGVIKWTTAPKPMEGSQIKELPLVRATCDTLTPKTEGDSVSLDTAGAAANVKMHVVKLTFKAPAVVSGPTMVMISGWTSAGFGITRGVIVVPQKIID